MRINHFHSLPFLFLKAKGNFPIELQKLIKGRFWRLYFLFSVKNRNATSLNSDMKELKIKCIINRNIYSVYLARLACSAERAQLTLYCWLWLGNESQTRIALDWPPSESNRMVEVKETLLTMNGRWALSF